MGAGPTIVRLARGGSSALDLDTEAGRAFLQERLAFYNKLCFLLSGGFFLVGALVAEWSEDDARAWWQRWRSQHTKPPEGSP